MKFLTLLAGAIVISGICLMWAPSPWPTAAVRLGGCALASVLIVLWVIRRVEINLHRALIPLCLTALWPLLQIAMSSTTYVWQTGQAALYWFCCLTWFFIALQLCQNPARTAALLRLLTFFSYAVALVAPLQRLSAPGYVFWLFPLPQGSSSIGPFLYANQYAAFLELLLPAALYAAFADSRFRLWHMGGSALLFTSVVAAQSRAGFFAAMAVTAVTVLLVFSRKLAAPRQMIRVLTRTGAVALILIAAVGPAALIRKFTAGNPYSVRREYLLSTVSMIRDRPLAGVGMGNWATVYPSYARFDDGTYVTQARNDWAQWAAEGGIPFLAFMVWFAWLSIRSAHRSIWGYGIAAIWLHSWVDYLIDRTAMAALFFLVAGAVIAARDLPHWD